jgi:hypothetical protein
MTPYVGGELALDVLIHGLLEQSKLAVAGIVDENIDPPELCKGGIDRLERCFGVRNVQRLREQHALRRATISSKRPYRGCR